MMNLPFVLWDFDSYYVGKKLSYAANAESSKHLYKCQKNGVKRRPLLLFLYLATAAPSSTASQSLCSFLQYLQYSPASFHDPQDDIRFLSPSALSSSTYFSLISHIASKPPSSHFKKCTRLDKSPWLISCGSAVLKYYNVKAH